MAESSSTPSLTPEEIRRLISRWCDGAVSDEEFALLETTLTDSASARQIYIDYMSVLAGVHGQASAIEYLETLTPLSREQRAGRSHWSAHSGWFAAAMVAAVVAAGLFSLRFPLLRTHDATVPSEATPAVANDAASPDSSSEPVRLARVLRVSPDCQWSLDHDSEPRRQVICAGDMIRVSRGVMKLRYDNGSELALHGPALFELVSEDYGRMLLGKLTAVIAKGAEGFSVSTPRATVIDLGTELGIEVDSEGATDVVVFEGLVDLAYQSDPEGVGLQKRLSAGEAMHLDAFGTISRIVSISNQRFSDQPSDGGRDTDPPIITMVRDNIQRSKAWNFYEIVHAGMREDARAFVDREEHEWNGIDSTGMPTYLVGGDYVKTFNNDKCSKDIEIVVSVAMPCHLYILFDERIDPPGWLRERFRNTGDLIGVDNGPWVYNGVPSTDDFPSVGPGLSIDSSMTIWVREITQPGPVTLGATETPHDDLNMYGIVAVPLSQGGPSGASD